MALEQRVRGSAVGRPDAAWCRLRVRVVGVGWLSAVGVCQHLHRNMLRAAEQLPRGLPAARE
eukprot:5854332-Alexandrium_andersonii.AAC.1